MGQEFFIKNDTLESKVRELLPSQGGLGQGFDLSASTQIVPIVDLTESAEGSNVRADLQTALSFDTATSFSVRNTTSTIINNTGYFRIFGTAVTFISTTAVDGSIVLTDGTTDKKIWSLSSFNNQVVTYDYDFNVFCAAGDSVKIIANNIIQFEGATRQIATIDGTLVNP